MTTTKKETRFADKQHEVLARSGRSQKVSGKNLVDTAVQEQIGFSGLFSEMPDY
jgi:hypothetical protein